MMPLLMLFVAALAVVSACVVVAVRDEQRDAFACRLPLHRGCAFCGGAR